jgi:polyisoprenoid-binding protein YceI
MSTSTTPSAPAHATVTYAIDASHSSAEFAVKHMMVSTVRGRFDDLEGAIHLDEADPTRSSVEAVVRTASVHTGVDFRDNDLRSDNFFDVERYPEMRFRSTRVEPGKDDRWLVHGDLTIRDVTRPVTLDTELEGRGQGMQGEDRIGFTATTAIDRKDFGLNYSAVLETGGVVVSDRVRITLHVEAARQR